MAKGNARGGEPGINALPSAEAFHPNHRDCEHDRMMSTMPMPLMSEGGHRALDHVPAASPMQTLGNFGAPESYWGDPLGPASATRTVSPTED